MADKELTVFLTDVGVNMGEKSGGRDITDLDLAMKYAQDIIATKVFRERKTDLVSLVEVESDKTHNSHQLEHINEVFDIIQPFYKHLKQLHPKPSTIKPSASSAGIIRGLLFTFQKIVAFVGKRKYKKNVVISTNSHTLPELDEEYIGAIVNLVTAAQVNMTLIGVDFDSIDSLTQEQKTNVEYWKLLFAQLPDSKIMTGNDVIQYFDQWRPKLVKPTRVFKGELRIGADLVDMDYEAHNDQNCIAIAVEGYPAVKPDKAPSRKIFGLDNQGLPVSISRETNYEIHNYKENVVNEEEAENNDDEDLEKRQYEIEHVDKEKLIKGYKYGKSTVVLNPVLEEQRIYRSSPGLDICGVIELSTLPRCYLTGEAIFIVGSDGASKDQLAINAIVDELTNLDCCAIGRYVAKTNSEVQMVVLIPVYVDNGGESIQRKRASDESDQELRALILTRLPFFEDEKIAAFPDLSQLVTTSGKVITGDHPLLPSEKAIDLMNEFVSMMDLDSTPSSSGSQRETDFNGNKRVFNAMNAAQSRDHHDVLVKDAFGIKRMNQVIKSIAIESSKLRGGVQEYCSNTSNIIPPLPENTVIDTHPPRELSEKAQPILLQLEEELHTEKVNKIPARKRRVLDEQDADMGFDEDLSLEKLLMRGKRD